MKSMAWQATRQAAIAAALERARQRRAGHG